MFAFRPGAARWLSLSASLLLGGVGLRVHDTTDGSLRHTDRKRVIVIGGGVCGLTTGWFLRQRGHDVCVLERDHVGSPFQASSINSGFLSNESSAIDLTADDLAAITPGQYTLNDILCAGSIRIYEQLQRLTGSSLGVRRTATIEVFDGVPCELAVRSHVCTAR
jgi:hypothetical protein